MTKTYFSTQSPAPFHGKLLKTSPLFSSFAGKGNMGNSWEVSSSAGKGKEKDNLRSREQTTLLIKFFFAKFKLLTGNPLYKLLPNGKMVVLVPYFSPKLNVFASDFFFNEKGVSLFSSFPTAEKENCSFPADSHMKSC